jgi:hypothetical protein
MGADPLASVTRLFVRRQSHLVGYLSVAESEIDHASRKSRRIWKSCSGFLSESQS